MQLLNTRSERRRVLVAATQDVQACLDGVMRFARTHEWHLCTDMLLTGAYPREWTGDGVIISAAFRPDLLRHVAGARLPHVVIGNDEEAPGSVCVRHDDVAIGRLAAEHLLERAHRNFAWAPYINDRTNRARFEGFDGVLRLHGCSPQILPPAHRRIGSYWHDDWGVYRATLAEKLRALPRPCAIFAANDTVAAEIIDLSHRLGLKVPDDISVIGVGNLGALCETLVTPLSSIELDGEGLAYAAANALHHLMEGAIASDGIELAPLRVVTRLSTEACAVAHSQVARALGYIADQFCEPNLGVSEIAEAVGCSRRQLERLFRAEMGSTVHEQIIKRRMQEASRLLIGHPRAKVNAIAELVGFEGAGTFFRTFRRYYGESPREHRLSARSPFALPAPDPSARVPA